MAGSAPEFRPDLVAYLARLQQRVDAIDPARKQRLREVSRFVGAARRDGDRAHLLSVCTHNSGRSILSEVWWTAAAAWYGLQATVVAHSGGTQATAVNPMILHSLVRAGFGVVQPDLAAAESTADNPVYVVDVAGGLDPCRLWSKRFDAVELPEGHFAAILNCSEADAACPFVPGSALRVALPYADPRDADDSEEARERYDARCDQVGTECLFAMAAAATEEL